MQEYRAYVIDQDGRIELRADLVCYDDDAARYRARQIANGRYVELWQGVTGALGRGHREQSRPQAGAGLS
jgi:hypothetical protein